jgi:hypothetical protein
MCINFIHHSLRAIAALIVIIFSGLIAGCGQLAPVLQSSKNPNQFDLSKEYNKVIIAKYDSGGLQEKLTEYEKNVESRKNIRNEVINDYMALVDSDYMYFKNGLLAGRAESDAVMDIAELLISTSSTLFGGLGGKANLGAASTLIKGSRSAYDKNFFAQQTIASIINLIEKGRNQVRQNIRSKIGLSSEEYSLSEAISDVNLYGNKANLLAGALDVANASAK